MHRDALGRDRGEQVKLGDWVISREFKWVGRCPKVVWRAGGEKSKPV